MSNDSKLRKVIKEYLKLEAARRDGSLDKPDAKRMERLKHKIAATAISGAKD